MVERQHKDLSERDLVVLVARAGIEMYDRLATQGCDIAVASVSRYSTRSAAVAFWTRPPKFDYDRVLIVDKRVATGLTQRAVQDALVEQGVTGTYLYAATASFAMGHRHQDSYWSERLFGDHPRPAADEYILFLVGLPGSGKSLVASLLGGLPSSSICRWGDSARRVVVDRYGSLTFDNVLRLAEHEREQDGLVVAKEVLVELAAHRNARIILVDGVKNVEQCLFVSTVLKRPYLVVVVEEDEAERARYVAMRRDFDDNDPRRAGMLDAMGLGDLIASSDFTVSRVGSGVEHDGQTAALRLSDRTVQDAHSLLSWISVRGESPATLAVLRAGMEREQRRRDGQSHG